MKEREAALQQHKADLEAKKTDTVQLSKRDKKEKIRAMIETATTLEEINRLELLLKSTELGETYTDVVKMK